MELPAYTDDKFWTDVIKQYAYNPNKCATWYNIDYHMWEYFKYCLLRKNRFFFHHPLFPLLEAEFVRHTIVLQQGTEIYRARIDRDNKLWNEWNKYREIESTPKVLKKIEKRNLSSDKLDGLWKEYENFVNAEETQVIRQRIESGFQGFDASGSTAPPNEYAVTGRCNPKGVSYLYAALEEHTAVAEIRPFIKDIVSIALLKPVRDLRLVNFDYDPTAVVNGKDFLFNNIQRDFSKLNKSQNEDYLITQFITSFIENLGYDGLCFRSSLVREGTNYVIFIPDSCKVISSKLFHLAEVNYVYKQCK